MMSTTKIDSFVVPVMGLAQQGCGVFVGNYFITAGHVIVDSEVSPSIVFEGKRIVLDKNKALKVCYSEQISGNEGESDFAVFAVDGINSPLKLADYKPLAGQVLRCITYDTVVQKDETPGIPEIFATKEEIVTVNCSAIVREETLGNFFACNTDYILKKGHSGSPVIDPENKIVGILRGGTYLPECCIFQYASVIKELTE